MKPSPNPSPIHLRPFNSGIGLAAEHASWRVHVAMRGSDLADTDALRDFVESSRGSLEELPEDADLSDRAWDLFYRAAACDDWVETSLYLEEANACDPTNVAVRTAMAVQQSDRWECVRRLEAVVADSEAELRDMLADVGELKGEVWGLLEVRPALRARAALADALIATGRLEAAIEVCRGLLELDPDDRQGARHVLVSLFVDVGDFDAAQELLTRWEDESSVFFTWARLLLAQQSGEDADALFEQAMAANPYALDALLYPEQFEPDPPGSFRSGTEEEAEILSELQWRAWHRRPEAIAWLRGRAGDAYLLAEDPTPAWERIVEGDQPGLRDSLLAFLDPADKDVFHRLVAYIELGPIEFRSHVFENALHLLHRLGLAERAVLEVVAYLTRLAAIPDGEDSAVMPVLGAAGEAAIVPLLAAHDAAADASTRERMLSGLVSTKVRDEEIYGRLVSFLDGDVFMGTNLLVDYGDSRAVPLISAHLDAADPDPAAAATSQVADLIGAIYDLGGELTGAQKKRFAFFVEARAQYESPEGRIELAKQLRESFQRIRARKAARERAWEEEQEEAACDWHEPPSSFSVGRPTEPTLVRADRPGRNEPCWCGSGTKYKRCHLAEDEAGSHR